MRNFFKKLRSDSWSKYFSKTVQRVGKNNAGFSLVELIVVIAIMAVLAAVAVIGVSIYSPQAQKAADEQLISDIEEALFLAYYSGELTESGYVVLTMNAAANPSDDAVRDTLLAAYGNLDELKLAHDGWSEGGNFGKYASSVDGSFVTNGTDALLKDVENCTGKLAEFMVQNGGSEFKGSQGAAQLDLLLQSNGAVSGMLSGYDDDEIDPNVLANAAVFGLASSLNNSETADAVINDFANMQCFTESINTAGNPNLLTDTAHKYAALEAFVNYVQSDGATQALNDFNTKGMSSADPIAIVNSLNNACAVAWEDAFNNATEKVIAYYGKTVVDDKLVDDPNVTKSPARQDGEAYVSTMLAVDSLSGDYAASLGNSGMFTDGTVSKDLDTYLNLAGAIPAEGAYYVVSFRITENGIVFDE